MSEQTPIANYDATSDQFKDIAARSQESDRKVTRSACMARASWCSNAPLAAFLGTTRPTAGDIAVFLPLTQADIDRKAAGGADVSQMEPHGAARSLHAIQNCPSNNTTPELVDLTSRFTHFLSPLRFSGCPTTE